MVKTLLDQYGRPIDRSLLSKPVATPEIMGVRRTIEDRVAHYMTPDRLAHVLIQAQNGHARDYLTLAEEMEERYLHYASQLQTRRLAIEGLTAVIEEPDGVPAKIVDAVRELMEGADVDDLCGDLTDGIGKGYSVAEIMWEYQGGKLRPAEYVWRDPRYFQFDKVALKTLRLASDTNMDGDELPPAKFIIHAPRTKAGVPLRRGLARPAAWAFLIQSFGLQDWVSFSEVYGLPIRVGRYHSNASPEDKRTLFRAVKSIANDAAAIIPQGMEIEFHKIEGQHGSAVFGELLSYVDQQISKLVVGQTMTADDGSSMAQAEVHNDVRMDILKADGKQLAATLNRDLIIPFVNFNFGPQPVYPMVSFPVPEPEDLTALADSLAKLLPHGFRVDQREIREKFGLSDPGADAELLEPRPPKIESDKPQNDKSGVQNKKADPRQDKDSQDDDRKEAKLAAFSGHHTGCQCGSCASLSATPGGLDELDRLLAGADWESIADPTFAPLQAILTEARSLEEAEKRLGEVVLESEPLRDALARLTAISRGLGDTSDE
ncbi:DUF935 domain-containing protein [Roseibium sediminis]|uniref:DUF935 domain-containing protein n=1 Tax=Roseibium sediminis TaxID=1775174 RepID=UPI00123CAB1E|nr:DUF935 domain-containing protein [Roseibium sediminis]